MADKGIGEDFVWFANYHFPSPPPSPTLPTSTAIPRPIVLTNPFHELQDADLLGTQELTLRFMRAVNENNLAPGLKMAYCANRPDSSTCDEDGQKSDTAFYRTKAAPIDKTQHWVDQLIACDFKVKRRSCASQDPFEDVPDSVDGITFPAFDHCQKNRDQILSYAELLFGVQQRVAVFMLLVLGRKCRLIRWDRSGFVVTRAIDYYKRWNLFVVVLWRISQSSNRRLGLDPTAHRIFPGDPDYEIMTRASKSLASDVDHTERFLRDDEVPEGPFVFKYVRDAFRESVGDGMWPRYRVEVPDGKNTRTFLIGKPTFRAKGLCGRGTRGYVALECGTGHFVWLKDAWRAHYLLVDKEGDILKRLANANVPNIPTLICHGDIDEQVTYTPQRWEEKNPEPAAAEFKLTSGTPPSSNITCSSSSNSQKRKLDTHERRDDVPLPKGLSLSGLPFRSDCPLRRHKHYRMAVQEVALALKDFEFGRQLVSVVKDCVIAHYHAYENLSILHRDVCGGNVLILPRLVETEDGTFKVEFTGILADWEMAKDSAITDPCQPERIGTWQYMSVALLSGNKDVEVCDELESFFYVLLYYATRYLRSALLDITIANYLDEVFDHFGVGEGRYVCGDKKKNTIASGRLEVADTVMLRFESNMDDVLADLLSWFKAHHVVSRYEQETAQAATSRSVVSTLRTSTSELKSAAAASVLARGAAGSRAPPRVSLPRKAFRRNGPSEEDREKAPLASSHAAVVTLFEEMESALGWSVDDKAGDRIPEDWRPDEKFYASSTRVSSSVEGSSKKKQKMEAGSLPLLPLSESVVQQGPRQTRTPSPPPLSVHPRTPS